MGLKLNIKQISKEFNKSVLFENLDLQIRDEEFCLLTGENGAGKTTLLNIIIGWSQASHGSIYFKNDTINLLKLKPPSRIKAGICYMPQDNILIDFLTVEKLYYITKDILGNKLHNYPQNIIYLLNELFSISKYGKEVIRSLSRGQKRRFLFYLTLLSNASLYIFDEPVSGWDSESKEIGYEIFSYLKNQGKSVIVCEHSPDKAFINNVDSRHILTAGGIKPC